MINSRKASIGDRSLGRSNHSTGKTLKGQSTDRSLGRSNDSISKTLRGNSTDRSLGRSNHSISKTLRGNSTDRSMHSRSVNRDGNPPEYHARKYSFAISELSESEHSRRSSNSGRRRSSDSTENSQHSRGANEYYQYQRGGNEMEYSGSGGASIAQSTRSRRNSGRRPSALMPIKEDPSRCALMANEYHDSPRGPPITRDNNQGGTALTRNRESVE
jgi:hypothetical protein